MRLTASRLIRSAGIAAMLAGVTFVIIQPLHPADTIGSVATTGWKAIHYATLAMIVLFVLGAAGIWARQLEQAGWLGLIGFLGLTVGLLLTAGFVFVEAFVQPLLVDTSPAVVEGLLGIVEGEPTGAELGALPTLWSLSGALFLGGCILFGIATLRARVLPRWAAATFAFGLVVSAPLAIALDAPRLTAVPIGVGLAWLGYALWSQPQQQAAGQGAPEASPAMVA